MSLDSISAWEYSVARFAWKNYGVSLEQVKSMSAREFMELDELMRIHYDQDQASYLDQRDAMNKK